MLKNLQVSVWAPWAAFAGACAGSLALDLASKQWAWDHLRPPGGPVVLWDPTLELSFAYNRGSAFGVVRQLDAPVLLLIITVLLIGWVIVTARGLGTLGLVGAGIIAGGALGNLHDRLFRVDELGQHGVVDFIRVNFPWGGSWPNFNVADAALVVGVLLLMWSMRPRGAGAGASA